MSAKRPPKWALWLRRLLLVLAGGSLILFLSLQILLATPWMRGRVAQSVTARTGLEVHMDRLGWTPWGGAIVEGLVVEQPSGVRELTDQPLLQVESVRVFPDYGACLRKQWWAHRIEVDRPELAVSVEMLASIAASSLPSSKPPALAVVEDPKPPPVVPAPGPPMTGQGKSPGPTPVPPQPPQITPEREAQKELVVAKFKPLEIEVEGASFRCFSATHSVELFRVEGLDCDVPLGIADRAGECRIEVISLLNQPIETNVQLRVLVEGDSVNIDIENSTEKEMQLSGNLKLKLIQGVPFQAVVRYESKVPQSWVVPGGLEVDVHTNQTLVQGGGWLRVPMTWQGLCRFLGRGIEAKDQGLEFDRYGGSLLLRRGVLQVPDVRLLGDQFGLLGNGWVNANAGAGVVRVVVPEGAAEAVRMRLGAGPLNALEPGNRRFVDVDFWREPEGWVTDLGGRTRPLAELWASDEGRAVPGGSGLSQDGR